MKKLILLLILVATASCTDNDDNSKLPSDNSLIGKWTWIKTEGSFNPTTSTPETTKENRVLEFSDSTVKTYINGNLVQTQKYTIKVQKSIYGGKRKIITIQSNSLTNEYNPERSFEIIGSKLILSDECADCYVSEYEKINPAAYILTEK